MSRTKREAISLAKRALKRNQESQAVCYDDNYNEYFVVAYDVYNSPSYQEYDLIAVID